MTGVTVRYWAAARSAAGVAEERVEAATLAAVIAEAASRHGPRLAALLPICSYLVGDVPAGNRDPATVALPAGSVVEILPPVAGG